MYSYATVAASLLLLSVFAMTAYACAFTENFSTNAFKDTVSTTANWDTTSGRLKSFPFVPTLVGTYDTPGLAQRLAAAL
jgi:hypothetical protein